MQEQQAADLTMDKVGKTDAVGEAEEAVDQDRKAEALSEAEVTTGVVNTATVAAEAARGGQLVGPERQDGCQAQAAG